MIACSSDSEGEASSPLSRFGLRRISDDGDNSDVADPGTTTLLADDAGKSMIEDKT